MAENGKRAVIIGAGPAGLTAAAELLRRTGIKPVILEMSSDVGGIAKTVNYKGNRIDIGGHRFFSKSERVMSWWASVLPVQGRPSRDEISLGLDTAAKYSATSSGPDPENTDRVMLIRGRISRIFFLRKFFSYPVTLSLETLLNLGPARVMRIGFSYLRVRLFPIRPEKTLEDFFINRFGRELYSTFFEDYTEKVWGVPCSGIKPEWGAQRVKGLSITKTILHALRKLLPSSRSDASQKHTETSLIEQFWYPKLGPGQLWRSVADGVTSSGGELIFEARVTGVRHEGGRIKSVTAATPQGEREFEADFFLSTMPVCDLVAAMSPAAPANVREVAAGLSYRDFVTVGLLMKKLRLSNRTALRTVNNVIPDNWIYIQERDVKIGRLQIFNNWSPYLVKDPSNVWLGLEYFCNEGDALWSMPDGKFSEFAAGELEKIGIIDRSDVLDSCVLRVQKTYPAYFGTYDRLGEVRAYMDGFENLFLIGRNGQHRYNNMDHSMLTAMLAVDAIERGDSSKAAVWSVNTEEDYHEAKKGS